MIEVINSVHKYAQEYATLRGRMLGSERRLEIVRLLGEEKVISVQALSARFGVSESTIRRDLQKLRQQGLLQRTYGGAVSTVAERAWDALEARDDPFLEVKRRIGKAAAQLITPGDTICLQAGSTTLQVARNLKGKSDLTVITNDIYVARELASFPGITVHLSGGTLRKDSRVLVGPLAEQTMGQFRVDKAFIGITAISLTEGLTNSDLLDAQIKTVMIRVAKEVIVVADHRKLGRVHFAPVAPITAIHKLVTDDGIPLEDVRALQGMGVEVIIARRGKEGGV